jgi:hypothetical protein
VLTILMMSGSRWSKFLLLLHMSPQMWRVFKESITSMRWPPIKWCKRFKPTRLPHKMRKMLVLVP